MQEEYTVQEYFERCTGNSGQTSCMCRKILIAVLRLPAYAQKSQECFHTACMCWTIRTNFGSRKLFPAHVGQFLGIIPTCVGNIVPEHEGQLLATLEYFLHV